MGPSSRKNLEKKNVFVVVTIASMYKVHIEAIYENDYHY